MTYFAALYIPINSIALVLGAQQRKPTYVDLIPSITESLRPSVGSTYRCHVTLLYGQLNLLKLDIYQLEIVRHNFHSYRMPSMFDRLFTSSVLSHKRSQGGSEGL